MHLMTTCLILQLLSLQGSTNIAASATRSCLSSFWSHLDQEAVFICSSYRPSNYFLCLFHLQTKLVSTGFESAIIIVIIALTIVINATCMNQVPGAHEI